MNPPHERPGQISWHYDRAEIIADGVVHAIGVCLGLIGAVTLVVMANRRGADLGLRHRLTYQRIRNEI